MAVAGKGQMKKAVVSQRAHVEPGLSRKRRSSGVVPARPAEHGNALRQEQREVQAIWKVGR